MIPRTLRDLLIVKRIQIAETVVCIPGPTLKMVRAHVATQGQVKGFLFCSEANTPILHQNLVRDIKGLIGKAGLPDIRFHDLQHLCATLHIQAGTNPALVAAILGHSTINLILNTYSLVCRRSPKKPLSEWTIC